MLDLINSTIKNSKDQSLQYIKSKEFENDKLNFNFSNEKKNFKSVKDFKFNKLQISTAVNMEINAIEKK